MACVQVFEWQSHRTAEVPNARLISPWLMRTLWMEHFAPYRGKEAELLKLVAMPKEDWVHATVKYDFAEDVV